jgi:hypothetical protein
MLSKCKIINSLHKNKHTQIMEPQNLKTRPALTIIELPYLMQARLKTRAAEGKDKYWNFHRCSTCHGSQCYSFYQAEPHLIDSCTCSAPAGTRPATWQEAAQHLLQFGTAADFAWWQIEQPGAPSALLASLLAEAPVATAEGAKVLHMQHRPEVAIDRMVLDCVAGRCTIVTVEFSSPYGSGIKQQLFDEELTPEHLQERLSDVLQWPEAGPDVLKWFARLPQLIPVHPKPAAGSPSPADLTPAADAGAVAAARHRLAGTHTLQNVVDVPIDEATLGPLLQEPTPGAAVPVRLSQRVVTFGRQHAGAPWVALSITPKSGPN